MTLQSMVLRCLFHVFIVFLTCVSQAGNAENLTVLYPKVFGIQRLQEIVRDYSPGTRLKVVTFSSDYDPNEFRRSVLNAKPSFVQDHFQQWGANEIVYLNRSSDPVDDIGAIAKELGVPFGSMKVLNIENKSQNYGGNIETFPGNIIVYGDQIDSEVIDYFRFSGDEPFELTTSFLHVGHVDELVSAIKVLDEDSGEIEKVLLLYSSPGLGLDLMEGEDESSLLEPNYTRPKRAPIQYMKWGEGCVSSVSSLRFNMKPMTVGNFKACSDLKEYNLNLQSRILSEVIELRDLMEKRTGNPVEIIPVPQLFLPIGSVERVKVEDETGAVSYSVSYKKQAVAINPNVVNSLILPEVLVVPDQNVRSFKEYILELLSDHIPVEFFEDSDAYMKHAGLHCRSFKYRSNIPTGF